MAPFNQIRKFANNILFNQLLYPRTGLLLEPQPCLKNEVSRFLDDRYQDLPSKIQFALQWCRQHLGPILNLANQSEDLSLALVKSQLATVSIENSLHRMTKLREQRERLAESEKQLFEIYPFDFSKFDIDKSFQTVFSSPNVMEELETELAILGGLRNVLSHLKNDGDFFVEVHNLDFFQTQPHFHTGTWRYLADVFWLDGKSRVWEKTVPGDKESQTVFEFATSNELGDFSSFRSSLHLFNQDQWMKLFEVAGFLVENCFGTWRGSEVSSQSPYLIFHLKSR